MLSPRALLFAVLGTALLTLVGPAAASLTDLSASQCPPSSQVPLSQADCLHVTFSVPSADGHHYARVQVRSECSAHGDATFRVLRRDDHPHGDLYTRWSGPGTYQAFSTMVAYTGELRCCEVEGSLCSIPELSTPSGCLRAFKESPAAAHCSSPALRVSVDSQHRCVVEADCTHVVSTSLVATPEELQDAVACEGELQLAGPC